MKRILMLVAAVVCAAPVAGQQSSEDPVLGPMRTFYQGVRGYLIGSAEQMPEAKYSFRPVPDVRGFGEILDHVTDSNRMACAAALGEPPPDAAARQDTKAARVAALVASFELCDRAFAQSAADAQTMTTFFGRERPRLAALQFALIHAFEHYGNLITYQRMNGLVPPSSQGGG